MAKRRLEAATENSNAAILFARFRLNVDPIADLQVNVLDFPAKAAIAEFLKGIRQLRGGEQDQIELHEHPSYRLLNAALLYLAPTLVHGFEKKVDWRSERHAIVLAQQRLRPRQTLYEPNSHQSSSNHESDAREAVALTQTTEPQTLWHPSLDQMTDVIAAWATMWAQTTFEDDLKKHDAAGLIEKLNNQILDEPESVWREHSIRDIWLHTHGADQSLRWKTIPSLLAMLFVARAHPLALGEEGGLRQTLNWNLVHDEDTGIAVISEPIRAHSKQGNDGLIAYKLEFRIQTQPGDDKTPWIALYISLRRYADHPIATKNDGGVSVYVRMGSRERKQGWGKSQTLVRLVAAGEIRKRKNGPRQFNLAWRDDLPELLSRIRGRHPVEPTSLFQDPGRFCPAGDSDTYLITHAEGIEYLIDGRRKGHQIKAGTSLKEGIDLYQSVVDTLGDILEPNGPLQVDTTATLSAAQIRNTPIYGLWTWSDLSSQFKAKTIKAGHRRPHIHEVLHQALQRAIDRKPMHIYVLYSADEAPQVVDKYLREMLFERDEMPLPASVSIHYLQFADADGHLSDPLPISFDNDAYRSAIGSAKDKMRRKFENDWRATWETRLNRVNAFLQRNVVADGEYAFALIELHKGFKFERPHDQWLKFLLRRAFTQRGVNSQMFLPVDERAMDLKSYAPGRAAIGRLRNALRDLVLRQSGVLFDTPANLYRHAGIPAELADKLCVIGLYRHRNQNGLDFPIAVRLFANGTLDFTLPDPATGEPLEPTSYSNGTALGEYLIKYADELSSFRSRAKGGQERQDRWAYFAAEIILQANRKHPTLILLEADGWRQLGGLPVADGKSEYNVFDLSRHAGHTRYVPSDLHNIRIVRVRDAGNLGETPQYVQVGGGIWGDILVTDDIEHMTLVRDTQTNSAVPIAFSIGRKMLSMGKQDNDTYSFSDGADIAHKHQRAVEFATLFHQPADDVSALLRIPHFLRLSPAWDGGNVILPYPIHLARTLVVDMLDTVAPKSTFKELTGQG